MTSGQKLSRSARTRFAVRAACVITLAAAALLPATATAAQNYIPVSLYSFTGTSGDGYYPYAGLIRDSAGNLYGTTYQGGAHGVGTVFELVNSSGSYSEQVLYSFTGTSGDGAYPYGGLVRDSAGNLYGTTEQGGIGGQGTVFELVNSSGSYTEQVLYSFADNGSDGYDPIAGLVWDSAGNLYGTTGSGGAQNVGTVFELVNSSGSYTEQVLYSFANNGSDGSLPMPG